MYFTEPDGRRARRDAAKYLIEVHLVTPLGDGLLVDTPQSWKLA